MQVPVTPTPMDQTPSLGLHCYQHSHVHMHIANKTKNSLWLYIKMWETKNNLKKVSVGGIDEKKVLGYNCWVPIVLKGK